MRRAHVAVLATAVLAGIALGLGGYTFAYARGWSYLTDDPAACANCHVMHEQHDAWIKGSHRSVATCNDCHVPAAFFGKWYMKARNGFWHSYYFTSGTFKEPIRATPKTREVVEANCRRCHETVVQAMGTPSHAGSDEISCIRCHSSVGHMELGATSVAAEGSR
ncbi:MAG: cytochrome c nitrite reductase small subunit [Planctomycetes bacterium]|nr:cytochrome c nitrite reductase small subunit [Planctomycetota bacterium]